MNNTDLQYIQEEIAEAQHEFDKWFDIQMGSLNQRKSIVESIKKQRETEIFKFEQQKKEIKSRITQIKNTKEDLNEYRKIKEEESQRIISSISEIPQECEYLQTKIDLLEKKITRNECNGVSNSHIISEMNAYEKLYGIRITVEHGKIMFFFKKSGKTLVLGQDHQKFNLESHDLPISVPIMGLISKLNEDHQLLKFLREIRTKL